MTQAAGTPAASAGANTVVASSATTGSSPAPTPVLKAGSVSSFPGSRRRAVQVVTIMRTPASCDLRKMCRLARAGYARSVSRGPVVVTSDNEDNCQSQLTSKHSSPSTSLHLKNAFNLKTRRYFNGDDAKLPQANDVTWGVQEGAWQHCVCPR
ncbi:unnamed protein product [Phytophthora fragariaefolia]|uniref:Unnamed protein product n=1 Tax=Phytophthora fragariaefolia TaxID=1490495 RepID=A0A9W7D167_9STRA|nr:unnamed protein product [Phytophthora fragariaefolia]